MTRKQSETLTEREAQIMQALWNADQPLTAEQIRDAMSDAPHDSTVRTLLRVLEKKRQVKRQASGKAHLYAAVVPQKKVQQSALKSLLNRFFGGSPNALLMRLLEDEQIDPAEIEQMRRVKRSKGDA